MPRSQANRLIAIDTPLGEDVLLLRGFNGHEGISQLFMFELDLLSEDPAIKFEDIIGKRVTIRVALSSDKERYFNGFISRFRQVGSDTGLANYRATMVPWLWFLTQTVDCRMFQNKSIPDIIEQIFKDLGFTDFKNLKGYEPREYCVQYRETDFNFVSRLMEQYGISYFFEHEKNKHTLVLADTSSAYQACPEQTKVKWAPTSAALEEDAITSLEIEQEFRPGKYALTDYNFQTPSTTLAAEVQSTIKIADNSKYEVYDYPGEYEKKGDGDKMVRLRMEEEEAQHLTITGTSMCRAFTSGYRFDLIEYIRSDMNKTYLLIDIRHTGSVGNAYTTGEVSGSIEYSNTFAAIPHAVPFRPSRMTPKPIIQGTQTAVVRGKPGEAIWCDKFGRVKVQFFWDRESNKDDQSSCWMRVSQNWGGKNWGGMFIPHVGQEVIVSFMEGDPDQPIITGRVYNAEEMPPLELPANATKSVIRDHGGNHIRMEGEKGKEQIHLFSPYGNSKISIGAPNNSEGIYCFSEKDLKIQIEKNVKKIVGEDYEVNVLGNHLFNIDKNLTEFFKGWKHDNVIGARTEFTGGIKNETTLGANIEVIFGSKSWILNGWEKELHKNDRSKKGQEKKEIHTKLSEWADKQISDLKEELKKVDTYTEKAKTHQTEADNFKTTAFKEMALASKKVALDAAKECHIKAGKLQQTVDGTATILADLLKLC